MKRSNSHLVRIMAIPESAFQTLNVSKHSVKVPSELGIEGRLAIFDTIHLLHCVVRCLFMFYL